MKYLTFNNGVKMPVLGYGTWKLRGNEGKKCILEALSAGYRLLDTAQMYENEDIVGQAVKESGVPREDIFITTKLYGISDSYDKAVKDIDKSLLTLQMDYVDLMLIHEPYEHALDMYQALLAAKQKGKIRAAGISNFNENQYLEFIHKCGSIPAVNQVESHVYYPRLKLKKVMAEHGTCMQSWGSFTEGKRNVFSEPLLVEIGHLYGKSAAQIALRYLLQNGIAVIPKSVNASHIRENMDIFDFSLTDEDMQRIDTLNEKQSLFGWDS